jgi:hypothetical protein
MITPAVVRQALGNALEGVSATVVAAGVVDGLPVLPAIVVGMPIWNHQEGTFCLDEWTVPVAVVSPAAGTSPTAELAQLEALWPQVAQHLIDATEADQTLGGLVGNCGVKGSEFGSYDVQGQSFPCVIINIEIIG